MNKVFLMIGVLAVATLTTASLAREARTPLSHESTLEQKQAVIKKALKITVPPSLSLATSIRFSPRKAYHNLQTYVTFSGGDLVIAPNNDVANDYFDAKVFTMYFVAVTNKYYLVDCAMQSASWGKPTTYSVQVTKVRGSSSTTEPIEVDVNGHMMVVLPKSSGNEKVQIGVTSNAALGIQISHRIYQCDVTPFDAP